jgi:hydrogenase small subunit
VPSGWAKVRGEATQVERAVSFFYDKLKAQGTRFEPGSARQQALQESASAYLRNRPTRQAAE